MTDPPKAGDAQVTFRKIVVPFEQEGPAEEPLFVNMCQASFHDDIVYIDFGIVPLDEVWNRAEKKELSFLLLNRLVMGISTLKNLRVQVDDLLDRLEQRETVQPSFEQTEESKGQSSIAIEKG